MDAQQLMDYFWDRGANRIGGGCYGTVYSLKDNPGWVVKHSRNDGTRTYLEWVLWRTREGKKMRGMPEIDFLHSTNSGENGRYIVAMKRYRDLPSDNGWCEFTCKKDLCPPYINELIKAFEQETGRRCTDLHSGNFMMDGKTVIMTDPIGTGYTPLNDPRKTPLELQTISDIGF